MDDAIILSDRVELRRRKVLLRVDANVPMQKGKITDATRIHHILPVIQKLIDAGAAVILASHRARPKGRRDKELSLWPVAQAIAAHVGRDIAFAEDCIGQGAAQAAHLNPGDVLMLENLRFHAGEEANDPSFARALAKHADIYVNDAFSCSHRPHASIVGVTEYLESYAGPGLANEISTLSRLCDQGTPPFGAIVGGSKISSKLALLESLSKRVDHLVIVGAMANTFIKAQGGSIGMSLCEDSMLDQALEIGRKAKNLVLAEDAVVTSQLTTGAQGRITSSHNIEESHMIADIGPRSRATIDAVIQQCQTILWNGPAGVFECPPFAEGSVHIARSLARASREDGKISVAGGGDTAAVIAAAGCAGDFSHISTGGGAFLAWLEGQTLPGVAALEKHAG